MQMRAVAEKAEELADQFRAIDDPYLRERKDVVIVGGCFILTAVLELDFWRKLASISGDITLAVVRDLTGSSRKYVLPLLEYFDSKSITRRVGDKRILLKKPQC